jgi:peptidoglycan/LPS O-acetylase OafA/YrhL
MTTASNVHGDRDGAGFNRSLHGFRGLAAIAVFFHHVYAGAVSADFWPTAAPSWLAVTLHSGMFGVELFFMISGYLITGSVIRHGNALRFLEDRVIRIYPALTVVLACIFVAGPVVHYGLLADITPARYVLDLLSNFLLLPGVLDLPIALLVAWSLSYEALFYLLCAAAYTQAVRGARGLALVVAVGSALLLIPLHPRAVFFLPGIAVWFWARRLRGRLPVEPLLLLVVFGFAWRGFIERHPCNSWITGGCGVPEASTAGLGLALLAIAAGTLLFVAIVNGQGLLSRLLQTRLFQFLGTISYSFYLWHTLVMFVTKRVLIGSMDVVAAPAAATWLFALLSLPPALFVSWLSYEYVEVRIGRRLRRRRAPSAPVAVAG